MVRGRKDKIFDGVVYAVLFLVFLVCFFPLVYVVVVSITPLSEVLKNGGFVVIPRKITWQAYQMILEDRDLIEAMGITLWSTTIGTVTSMIFSVLTGYALSKKGMPGRSLFVFLLMFTMMFSGGAIPLYLLVRKLDMINSIWALILPGCMSTYNVIVLKNFYENMPAELFESARIDGAGEFRVLTKIVMPLSKPVFMTVGLFYMVGYWNSYFPSIMYFTDGSKYTLQVVLRSLLMMTANLNNSNVDMVVPSSTFQMAAVVFSTIPILVVYPFIQKHFSQGMMLGAVKG